MTLFSLNDYSKNITSQFGEDGIIDEIFNRIGTVNNICIEFGAWDGKYLSNVWNLWHNHNWAAFLIESDKERFHGLKARCKEFPLVKPICAHVTPEGENSLDSILMHVNAPPVFDLLVIDVDGDDYYIFEKLDNFKPRVIVVEHNPTIPPEYEIVQAPGEHFGSSALALVNLAHKKGYQLAGCTEVNCFFINQTDFSRLGIMEPELADVFVKNQLVYVITSFAGTPFLNRQPGYPTSFRKYPHPIQLFLKLFSKNQKIIIPHLRISLPGNLIPVEIFKPDQDHLKALIKETFIYKIWGRGRKFIKKYKNRKLSYQQLQKWYKDGKPIPPPNLYKQSVIREYAKKYKLDILLETGTYLGEMVEAQRKNFDIIYSVELSYELYFKAINKFKKFKHIKLYQGDSGEVIPEILKEIDKPCLFWLDGHYSGENTAKGKLETPIIKELLCILNHSVKFHVILIDDARLFVGESDYPNQEELRNIVLKISPDSVIQVSDDIIRIYKK